MSKRARRILVTALVLAFAALIVWTVFNGRPRNTTARQAATQSSTQPGATGTQPTTTQPDMAAATAPGDESAATAPQTQPQALTAAQGLRAVAPGGDIGPRDAAPQPLGSLDPRTDVMRLRLSRFGAGIERLEFANLWQSALARRQAARILKSAGANGPLDLSQMPEEERYILVERSPSKFFNELANEWRYSQVPVMAARWLFIGGVKLDMLNDDAWSETAPGVFESSIRTEAGEELARVTRRYRLGHDFDISIEQRVRNASPHPLSIAWGQYGPVDLPTDRDSYIERRRVHFGTQPEPQNRPQLVLADDNLVLERSSALKQYQRSTETPDPAQQQLLRRLWPTDRSIAGGWELAWFGFTNRYFGLTVHPIAAGDQPSAFTLGDAVREIEVGASAIGQPGETLFTTLQGAAVDVAPGGEANFDVGLFAGPLDRDLLDQPPFAPLSMGGMIFYSMSGCCTFLTFQWLAHLLLWFLSFLHDFVLFDWGMAIIGLVVVVRGLLHPLTKKSQINMQRFGKQMQALKPEIDKLQKKYGGDAKRMQTEQMRLMREHGINPLQMLGCLPMFLQMPIWIALWAMLYLAFDLRQQPAFYGIFQMLYDRWPFLADLSSPDKFIPLGAGFTIPLVGIQITSINLLPILMGVVFFIQQKYMTPPTTANMTPEQIQQQKIMKWMMVILFPLMMYKAPSGLTLYIMTSSIIGILEGRYVRRHIDELDKNPPALAAAGANKPKKPKDSLARAWAARLEAMREKQRLAQQERKSFKKRK